MDTGLPWLSKAVLQTVVTHKEARMEQRYDCPEKKPREWIKKADQVSGLREWVKKDLSGSLRNRQ